MKKVGFIVTGLPLLLAAGISQAEQATSAKQLTLGVGSTSMNAEEQGGSLISLSNGVSSQYKVSTEVFLNSQETKTDDVKEETNFTTIQAHGLIPITKLSGATNSTGVGVIVTSRTGETEYEKDPKLETGDRNIGLYGTVGLKNIDVALSLNNIERTFDSGDEVSYDYNTVSLSGSFNMSEETRMSVIYTPSSFDFYDDGESEHRPGGELSSMTISGTHKLSGPKLLLTSGLQRYIPQTLEKDIEGGTIKSTANGATVVSIGAQIDMGDFKPRAGLSNSTSQDDSDQILGLGTDYLIKDIVVTGDVAFINGNETSGDNESKTTGFNFSAGVATMF